VLYDRVGCCAFFKSQKANRSGFCTLIECIIAIDVEKKTLKGYAAAAGSDLSISRQDAAL
jgi:hypothetical protein